LGIVAWTMSAALVSNTGPSVTKWGATYCTRIAGELRLGSASETGLLADVRTFCTVELDTEMGGGGGGVDSNGSGDGYNMIFLSWR